MKKKGILNDRLNLLLARLGHGDWIVVADCGLPIPDGVWRIDLALVPGIPSFADVVRAVAGEIAVQKLIVATEMRDRNSPNLKLLRELFPSAAVEEVPHAEFKELTKRARAVIRTGEATPYANVILESGVIF
ncbi:MAG: D-ribose pyranase [Caldiserica bacterium]|nr:D-ribose pyranase [Caldisericota bacterium]